MKNIILLILLSVFGFAGDNKHTMFSCIFSTYATEKGFFHGNVIKFKIITNSNNDTFNRKWNDTISVGNIIRAEKGFSFVEMGKLGNIITTTMTMVSPFESEQKAVFSKNILKAGELLASQYYGTCQIVGESQTKKLKVSISKERRQKIYKNQEIKKKLKTFSKKDTKYVFEALTGIFPSRQEMEDDMSLDAMILISGIMEEAVSIP